MKTFDLRSCPKNVVEYFDHNWHPLKDEWVLGLKAECGSFLNMTNNRLGSINEKLKQVINHHSSLQEFIDKLFIILQSLQTERDHKAALTFHKTNVFLFSKNSDERRYCQLLTSYASSFVVKQLKLVGKVKEIQRKYEKYVVEKPPRRLSQHEKFKKASVCTTELAAVISEASHVNFHRRLEIVRSLCEYWKSGKEVGLKLIDEGLYSTYVTS